MTQFYLFFLNDLLSLLLYVVGQDIVMYVNSPGGSVTAGNIYTSLPFTFFHFF